MKQDSLVLGAVIGAIAPILAYLLTNFTSLQVDFFAGKPLAIYVIAAVVNLIVVRFTSRAGKETFAKGVILITFIAMLILVLGMRFKI